MKTFRVFVERHYIAVERFDIVAKTARAAKSKAVNAANRIRPDARKQATDSGWIADEPTEIPAIGSYGENGINRDKSGIEIKVGVFHFE